MKAIDGAVGSEGVLLEYAVSAVTSGKDALGEARVVCDIGGRRFAGQSVSTDVLEASAVAYVRAVNASLTAESGERVTGGRGVTMGRTLFDKVWDAHEVRPAGTDGPAILYVDLHLVHEVTSPQAFEGLRLAGRRVRRPDRTLATVDHNVPTVRPGARRRGPALGAPSSRPWSATAPSSASRCYALSSPRQGIVHVIGPELGLTQPGHDHRLRRQPHLHPRRLRRAGLRHRHQRGGARAGHPDACASTSPRTMRSHASTARSRPGVTAKDLILGIDRRHRRRRRRPAT